MAYFSTWQLHGNRVSKTRFITLINKMKSDQNIRGQPEKKKTQKQKRERRWDRGEKKPPEHRRRWRSEKKNHQNLGRRLTQAAREPRPRASPGCAQPRPSREPRPRANQAVTRAQVVRKPGRCASPGYAPVRWALSPFDLSLSVWDCCVWDFWNLFMGVWAGTWYFKFF